MPQSYAVHLGTQLALHFYTALSTALYDCPAAVTQGLSQLLMLPMGVQCMSLELFNSKSGNELGAEVRSI